MEWLAAGMKGLKLREQVFVALSGSRTGSEPVRSKFLYETQFSLFRDPGSFGEGVTEWSYEHSGSSTGSNSKVATQGHG
jgi:hypothetical protein